MPQRSSLSPNVTRLTAKLILALLAGVAPTPLLAQSSQSQSAAPEAAAPDSTDDQGEDFEGQEMVVTGQPQRGAVPGDIPPEIQLDQRDIRAYGVSNLAELLDALSPQTGSSRGRGDNPPVVLVNGTRISSIAEIRDLPPEAVERLDILPEEVALKYGYRADQRVVNLVLRRRFNAITSEVEGSLATAGGRTTREIETNIVRINRDSRWTIDAKYEGESALYENERDIVQAPSHLPFDRTGNIGASNFGQEIDPALSALLGETVTVAAVPVSAASGTPLLTAFGADPNVTDQKPYRSLLPRTGQLTVNGTYSRTIFGNVAATINANYDRSTSRSRFGLPSAAIDIPATNIFSPFSSDVTLFRLFDSVHPLTRGNRTDTGHLGLTLNGELAGWRWSFTANYDRARSLTRTDNSLDLDDASQRIEAGDPSLNPFGPLPDLTFGPRDRARSTNQTGEAELVASGTLFSLPAGSVNSTFKLGIEASGFDSSARRSGILDERDFSRSDLSAQASIDLPIASRKNNVLAALGDLSLNGNFALDRLSDFGTLLVYGGGVNWSPAKPVRIIASVTQEQGAPGVAQLGNPLLLVPNVRVFDFVRGETVDITQIEGGNPALRADSRRVFKLGLTLRPFSGDTDFTLRADYTASRIRNTIASFPTATAEIEAAFPDRFERDEDGQLLSIDTRPVNFKRADTAQLRWGFNFSKPIASRRPFRGNGGGWRSRRDGERSEAGAPATPTTDQSTPSTSASDIRSAMESAARSARDAEPPRPQGRDGDGAGRPGGRGGFGRGFGRGGPGQGGRLQFALFHTWRFKDVVVIRDGVPELDFLDGSAVGNRGGRPRHQIEAQAGMARNGFGARFAANWVSGTTVRGDPLNGASDLRFSDLATVNFRLFADVGQQPFARDHRWMRGLRVTLKVNNLLNSRPKVRDATGATPLSYQPDYLDPLGRTLALSIRKQFF
jgi:hypothetical protein